MASELALPELERSGGDPDIVVTWAAGPAAVDLRARRPLTDEAGGVWVAVAEGDGTTVLSFPGVAEFVVDLAGHRITCHPLADEGAVRHALLDQVIPRLLTATGSTVLHASGVVVEGSAVLFAGPSGAGKSTLAARCARRGHRLLGDDAMVVEHQQGAWTALAGYPGLRLWPDSVDLLDVDVTSRPLAEGSLKSRIDMPEPAPGVTGSAAADPGRGPAAGPPGAQPLAAIAMIDRRPGPVDGRCLRGTEAFSRLWETTFSWPGTVVDGALLDRVTALATEACVLRVGFADDADVVAVVERVASLAAAR